MNRTKLEQLIELGRKRSPNEPVEPDNSNYVLSLIMNDTTPDKIDFERFNVNEIDELISYLYAEFDYVEEDGVYVSLGAENRLEQLEEISLVLKEFHYQPRPVKSPYFFI